MFLVVGFAILAVALLAATIWRAARASRTKQLRGRLGPESEAVLDKSGKAGANRILDARERRVAKLELRSLSPSERAGFAQSWRLRQEQFVDAPSTAVSAAHELVSRVMHTRGYRVEDFEQQLADLSVDHASIVHHFRAAYSLEQANRAGRANTEELRQAMVHYRALFDELLATTIPSDFLPPSERAPESASPSISGSH